MTPVIIDAGPALNFLAAGQHGLLCDVVEQRNRSLVMPETVRGEVHSIVDRPRVKGMFEACPKRLEDLISAQRVHVLADDITDKDLVTYVERVAGMPAAKRMTTAKDLGETLVLAHALRLRAQGEAVTVLIDEVDGTRRARMYGLAVVTSTRVLFDAAKLDLVATRTDMRKLYELISSFDSGMPRWDRDPTRNPLADRTIYLEHRQKSQAQPGASAAEDPLVGRHP